MPYDKIALKKDLEQVEKEIHVFKDMLLKLMERRINLQQLIKEAEEREEKEEALKIGEAVQKIDIPVKYIEPTKASQANLGIKERTLEPVDPRLLVQKPKRKGDEHCQ